jgi:hypothetical protein
VNGVETGWKGAEHTALWHAPPPGEDARRDAIEPSSRCGHPWNNA